MPSGELLAIGTYSRDVRDCLDFEPENLEPRYGREVMIQVMRVRSELHCNLAQALGVFEWKIDEHCITSQQMRRLLAAGAFKPLINSNPSLSPRVKTLKKLALTGRFKFFYRPDPED